MRNIFQLLDKFSYCAIHAKKFRLATNEKDNCDLCPCMQFNARSESIKEKASFRRLVPTNRCLVAVEGYDRIEYLYLFCFVLFPLLFIYKLVSHNISSIEKYHYEFL